MPNPHGQKKGQRQENVYILYFKGLNINAAVYHCCQYQWSAHRMQANQGGKN